MERLALARELDAYVLTTAYSVPYLLSQRIVVMPKKIKGWDMTPSHYLSQDLAGVWLDQRGTRFQVSRTSLVLHLFPDT